VRPTLVDVLAPEELLAIDQASREVLQRAGVRVRSRELLDRFADLGLAVDHDRLRVRFDPQQVQQALDLVPRGFRIFDRDGRPAFALGRGEPPRFAAGFNATFLLEPSGRRPATRADVARCARLADCLEEIDLVGPAAVPHDVPARAAGLHAVAEVLGSTRKPLLFAPESDGETRAILEMLRAVGGQSAAGPRPAGICQFSPSSPLFWSEGALRGFLRVAGEGFPCIILPGPLAGATSPYTLAANLVQKNSEALAAVVLAQLTRPGTPLLVYNAGGQFDMRCQTAVFGSPEVTLILLAGTQLARYYGLPTHACFPSSDSHCLDEQLGIENAVQLLACLFAGADLMVNAGMFAGGQTVCPEQLVIDNDLYTLVRRIGRGFPVDAPHLCREAFGRVEPEGSFLEDPTTIAHLRSGEWSELRVLGRQDHERWRREGSPTASDRARRIVEELAGREPASLDESRQRQLRRILSDFEQGG
jgi:trimethylamine--corrinoid protein Co-methyltransferase